MINTHPTQCNICGGPVTYGSNARVYEDGTGEWALVCKGYMYSIDTLEGAGLDFVDYMRGEKLEPHGYKVYRRPPEGEEDT